MTLLKNLHYMLHLMKRVYVEPEEENYKRIVCKGKIQQWNQFQQIKRRCVLGMEPKLQRNIQLLLCRGGHFNVTPHPMERLFLKINIILKKTKEKKNKGGWGMKHEEYLWGAIYNKMFHLKSLVSYYRDLLFCPYNCFKLRNRDVRDTDGRNILHFVSPKGGVGDQKWIPVMLQATKSKDSGECNTGYKWKSDASLYHTPAFLHHGQTGLIHIENDEDYTHKLQTP